MYVGMWYVVVFLVVFVNWNEKTCNIKLTEENRKQHERKSSAFHA